MAVILRHSTEFGSFGGNYAEMVIDNLTLSAIENNEI